MRKVITHRIFYILDGLNFGVNFSPDPCLMYSDIFHNTVENNMSATVWRNLCI